MKKRNGRECRPGFFRAGGDGVMLRYQDFLDEKPRSLRDRLWNSPVGVLLVIAMVLALFTLMTGCSLTNVEQTTGATTVTQAPPPSTAAPSPSPSGSPAATGAVAKVEVHFYGTQTCPAGKSPAVGEREIRNGCVQATTASPFNAQGQDVGQPGDAVEWSCSGGALLLVQQTNHYNRDVQGVTPGSFTCLATVQGVTGTLAGTVVP